MGAAAGVGADQHPATQLAWQLGQGQPGGLDMVGGGVRSGVPGPEQDGQRLARPVRAVIGEDGQGMEAPGFLPRGSGLFLVRARGHDGGVDIDSDQAAARAGRRVGGQLPAPLPRRRAGSADRLQRAGRVGGQAGDQPGDHWVGGHRAKQPGLAAERRDVGQAVTAQRQGHGQVGDYLSRAVHGPGLLPPFQGAGQAAVQGGDPQCPGQQQAAGVGDDAGAISGHRDLGPADSRMHAKSAFRTGQDRSLDKPYSSSSKALFMPK